MAKQKLTPKQKLFVKYYIKTLNATESARLAWYSHKSANEIWHENLTKPSIRAEINKSLHKKMEKADIDGQWVIDNLVDIVEKCTQKKKIKFPKKIKDDDGNLTDIEYIDVYGGYDPNGANTALDKLGKYFQLFRDNKINIDISHNIVKVWKKKSQ